MQQHQPDETTQRMPAVPQDGQSRRDFLKAAVIGSAAVATAGGAVAAGYALTSRKPSTVRVIFHDASGDPCRGCLTDTAPATTTTFTISGSGESSPGAWYLWFTDHALPSGSYDVNVTMNVFAINGGSTFTSYSFGDAGAPFAYLGSNSVQIFSLATAQDCPTSLPSSPVTTNDTLAKIDPFTWTESGTNDMQMSIHMKYSGGTIGPVGTTERIDFVITINKDGVATPLCSETVTVTGTQGS